MKQIWFTYQSKQIEANRFLYTVDFINRHPLKPKHLQFLVGSDPASGIHISYGDQSTEADYHIPAQHQFFVNNDVVNRDVVLNQYHLHANVILSAEVQKRPTTSFLKKNCFQFDLLEAVFFHISRYEEVFADQTDHNQAGWLEETKHTLIKNKTQDIPVVDYLLKVFYDTFLGVDQTARSSTYSLSHDVDVLTRFKPVSKFFRAMAGSIYYKDRRRQLSGNLSYYFSMLFDDKKDPYDHFEMLISDDFRWKSKTIYLMTGGNTPFDNKYKIEDARIEEIINLSLLHNYEIGLHPSYEAGMNESMYEQELLRLSKRIDQDVSISRQHWLRFDWNITPYIWEKFDLKEDSSMGYNNHLGFRCGTGFPFQMYDFQNERKFSWIERPLAFMESSAIHLAKDTGSELLEEMTSFLQKNRTNTHIEFNFHNSNFDPLLDTGKVLKDFYMNYIPNLLHDD